MEDSDSVKSIWVEKLEFWILTWSDFQSSIWSWVRAVRTMGSNFEFKHSGLKTRSQFELSLNERGVNSSRAWACVKLDSFAQLAALPPNYQAKEPNSLAVGFDYSTIPPPFSLSLYIYTHALLGEANSYWISLFFSSLGSNLTLF